MKRFLKSSTILPALLLVGAPLAPARAQQRGQQAPAQNAANVQPDVQL